jgi:hypothetical protein
MSLIYKNENIHLSLQIRKKNAFRSHPQAIIGATQTTIGSSIGDAIMTIACVKIEDSGSGAITMTGYSLLPRLILELPNQESPIHCSKPKICC